MDPLRYLPRTVAEYGVAIGLVAVAATIIAGVIIWIHLSALLAKALT
jgi:hypothetical protein